MKWVPVSERLPEKGVNVLISMSDNRVEIAYRADANWFNDYGNVWDHSEVEAWMPLPKPYAKIFMGKTSKTDKGREIIEWIKNECYSAKDCMDCPFYVYREGEDDADDFSHWCIFGDPPDFWDGLQVHEVKQ